MDIRLSAEDNGEGYEIKKRTQTLQNRVGALYFVREYNEVVQNGATRCDLQNMVEEGSI